MSELLYCSRVSVRYLLRELLRAIRSSSNCAYQSVVTVQWSSPVSPMARSIRDALGCRTLKSIGHRRSSRVGGLHVSLHALLCIAADAMPDLVVPACAAIAGPEHRREGADERVVVKWRTDAARTAAAWQLST
jgi:hypothetical protein